MLCPAHRHGGRWYVVEFPAGTRVHRSRLTGMTLLTVPWQGRQVPGLRRARWAHRPQLARSPRRYGLRLVEEEPARREGDVS